MDVQAMRVGGNVSAIPSYPKIYAVGHREVRDIFRFPVLVQEKIDGSQFS